jgi:16S rRNA processing protein RimM
LAENAAHEVPGDLTQVGHVSGAYGVLGAVRVSPYSVDADALLQVKTWWLDKPSLRPVQVRTARMHSGDLVATLVDVDGRDAAEALKGATVQVPRSAFPELPEDEYYWSDLIGMDAVNLQGDALGKVTDMMHNGAQSILRITPVPGHAPSGGLTTNQAQERLVPFVDQFVKHVDMAGKKITLDWGLDY